MNGPEKTNSAENSSRRTWRFADFFRFGRQPDEQLKPSPLVDDLKSNYPDNAKEIISFMTNVIRRRESIVERLKKYPELNDHGFFMVMCLMYLDTYKGIGHTSSRLTHLIEIFSTSEISIGTAARKLQKANEVSVFISDRDAIDSRKQRYYLHPEMITIFSETFGGMIDDVKNWLPEGEQTDNTVSGQNI